MMKTAIFVTAITCLAYSASAQTEQECPVDLITVPSYHGDFSVTVNAPNDTCGPVVVYVEPAIRSLSFVTDQDRFVSRFNEDRNYTMGFGIRLTGYGTNKWWYLTPLPQHYIDQGLLRLILRKKYNSGVLSVKTYGIMLGAAAFTPEEIGKTEPVLNDRPYASDLYIQGSRTYFLDRSKGIQMAFNSEFSLGFLGLNVSEFVQTAIHSGARIHKPGNREDPKGWSNQIAHGGALSTRYSIDAIFNLTQRNNSDQIEAREYLKVVPHFDYYVNLSAGLSTGVYNYLRIGSSGKLGHFRGRFYDTTNELLQGSPAFGSPIGLARDVQEELRQSIGKPYFSVSNFQWSIFYETSLNYWLYNAMIQGWYGQDVYNYRYEDIEPITLNAALGLGLKFNQLGLKASVNLRTNEMRIEVNKRTHWGAQVAIYFDLVR